MSGILWKMYLYLLLFFQVLINTIQFKFHLHKHTEQIIKRYCDKMHHFNMAIIQGDEPKTMFLVVLPHNINYEIKKKNMRVQNLTTEITPVNKTISYNKVTKDIIWTESIKRSMLYLAVV